LGILRTFPDHNQINKATLAVVGCSIVYWPEQFKEGRITITVTSFQNGNRNDVRHVSVLHRFKLEPENGTKALYVDFGSHDLCIEILCWDEST
jgi:hypothetical protein